MFELPIGIRRANPRSLYSHVSAFDIARKYIYDHSFFRGFGQDFFFVSASVCDSRYSNSRSNSFVRAPSTGDGSNAPRLAVSVPHLDVNVDG